MRILVSVLALALVFGFSSSVMAAKGDKKAGSKPVAGKIVKVDGSNLVVSSKSKTGDAQEVTVALDKEAKITINGVAGTAADLKADMRVKVTGSGATQTVEATSGRAGGKKK